MAAAAAELEKCKAAIRNSLETLNRPFNGTNLGDLLHERQCLFIMICGKHLLTETIPRLQSG